MTASPVTDQPTGVAVRKAGSDDAATLVDVLARAFDDDPVINWFVRQDADRASGLRRFFEVAVEQLTLPLGEVYTTAEPGGAALWAPPGAWELDPDDLDPLLPDLTAAFGEARLERSLEGMAAMDAVHPDEPHFYLLLLGVAPDRQNRGIGGALLQAVLRRCDEQGVPAYLEATSPRNVALYERHGFVVTDTLHLPGGGPPLWLMWRAPRPVQADRPAETARCNGIDLEQLRGLAGVMRDQPGAGTVTIRTRHAWDDAFAVDGRAESITSAGQTLAREHTFRIDWPHAFGGTDSGPTSGESLLATLGACVAQTYTITAALHGVTIDELDVAVEGSVDLRAAFDEDPRAGLVEVSVTVAVHSSADEPTLDAIGSAVTTGSPVFASLANPVAARLSVRRLR